MCRWILIDNRTGHICGDSAEIDGGTFDGQPVVFAQRLDERLGNPRRDYFELPFAAGGNGQSGFFCYRAAPNMPAVRDWQNSETIAAVKRDCAPVCFVCAKD